MEDILKSFKTAAIEAIEASDPTAVQFGEVISVSPLKILVEQKKALTIAQLILTRNVKDYEVEMTLEQVKKKFMIHNALKQGDMVILIKMQGGQKYIVWDKEVS